MKVRIKRTLGTIGVGILGGAFLGFVVVLIIPFDPLVWLSGVMVGAMFGACMAVWVILRHPRGTRGEDELARTR